LKASLGFALIPRVRPYSASLLRLILGERESYDGTSWKIVDPKDYSRVPKLEGQVVFHNPSCLKMFEV